MPRFKAAVGRLLRRIATVVGHGVGDSDLDEAIARQLTEWFEGLTGQEREQVAVALALLWSAFLDRFRSVDAFRRLEPREREAYFRDLDLAAGRMAPHQHGPKGYYYFAVLSMLCYTRGLVQEASEPAVILSTRISRAIEAGRNAARPKA